MAFWNKEDQLRIDETFAWLVARVLGAERRAVSNFLTKWLNKYYKVGGSTGWKDLSQSMSIGTFSTGMGDKDTRAARRALVLLRCEMLSPQHPLKLSVADIMSMPSARVIATVNEMLPNFRLFAMQAEGAKGMLEFKLHELKTQPQAFLAKYEILTQSANNVQIGVPGDHRFVFDYYNQRFFIATRDTPRHNRIEGDGILFTAVNVPEVLWFRVPGRGEAPNGSFARLPCTELTGAADLMVTSIFNGCSFFVKKTGGRTFAAHIGPDDGQGHYVGPPPTLATQISQTGNFNDNPAAAPAGVTHVFGRGLSNIAGRAGGYYSDVAVQAATPRKVCIIGTRAGTNWSFVAQEFADRREVTVIPLF